MKTENTQHPVLVQSIYQNGVYLFTLPDKETANDKFTIRKGQSYE